jgi:hypothetical protein
VPLIVRGVYGAFPSMDWRTALVMALALEQVSLKNLSEM